VHWQAFFIINVLLSSEERFSLLKLINMIPVIGNFNIFVYVFISMQKPTKSGQFCKCLQEKIRQICMISETFAGNGKICDLACDF